jgi:hypothetical protein
MKRKQHRVPMEMLENRLLMSVVPVLNNGDTGADTLRAAIAAAQSGDTIDLSGVSGTITLNSEIAINKDLTITGPGASTLSLDGNSTNRIFNISSDTTVSISGLTFTNGFNDFLGGAIFSYGTLTVSGCAFSQNRATGDFEFAEGGAIWTNTGSLHVSNSTFSSNSVTGGSGEGSWGEGGAIWSSVPTTISNCTFSGNSAAGGDSPEAPWGEGGAVWLSGSGDTITNCTIANNSALPGSEGFASGGGIYGNATISNSIIAGNTAESNVNLDGTYTSGGHNLIGTSTTGFTNGVNGDIVGSDPMLNALADNGGSTETLSLQEGSPAINAGDDEAAPTTDQRGYPRVSAADIGAYEFGSSLVNHAPTFSSTAIDKAYSGTQYDYEIGTTDSDGDSITITAPTLPSWLTLSDNGDGTATLSGMPADSNFGSNPIVLQVGDGDDSTQQSFDLSVIVQKRHFVGDSTLRINGTNADDNIHVWLRDDQVRVVINGVTRNYAASDVSAIQVFTFDGNDTVTLNTPGINAYALGGAGNDTLAGGDEYDILTGAGGNDRIIGYGGDDRLNGSSGNDVLGGGAGDDRLYGGEGNDTLDGGDGADHLYGNGGDDAFVSYDNHTDFVSGGAGNNIAVVDGMLDKADDITSFLSPSLLVGKKYKRLA